LVSRDHPLGSTPVPKIAERIDHGTKYPDVLPYVENRKMHATSTVVNIYFIFIFKIFLLLIFLVGKNS
jgi:hypothetical protein